MRATRFSQIASGAAFSPDEAPEGGTIYIWALDNPEVLPSLNPSYPHCGSSCSGIAAFVRMASSLDPTYDPEAGADAEARTKAFFDKLLR